MKLVLMTNEVNKIVEAYIQEIVNKEKCNVQYIPKKRVAEVLLEQSIPKYLHFFIPKIVDKFIDNIELMFGKDIIINYVYEIIDQYLELDGNNKLNNVLFVVSNINLNDIKYIKGKGERVVSISTNKINSMDFTIGNEFSYLLSKAIVSSFYKQD